MTDYSERNSSMTTTGPCEMSGPSPKFFGAGSKFPDIPLFRPTLFIKDDSRTRGCHSTVKPAKKSFVTVMFQCSVSNLLHVFCSFPNSFPKVSVVNMVHRQKGQQNPKVFFWRQDESPSLSANIYA